VTARSNRFRGGDDPRPRKGGEPEHARRPRLAQGGTAPDLTQRIMGRLGYMKASPRVVRRRITRRWCARALLCAAIVAFAGIGLRLQEYEVRVQRRGGPTIPAALGRDVDIHHRRVQRSIQTIRNLVPRLPESSVSDDPSPDIDEDIDRSAIGPFRWL